MCFQIRGNLPPLSLENHCGKIQLLKLSSCRAYPLISSQKNFYPYFANYALMFYFDFSGILKYCGKNNVGMLNEITSNPAFSDGSNINVR